MWQLPAAVSLWCIRVTGRKSAALALCCAPIAKFHYVRPRWWCALKELTGLDRAEQGATTQLASPIVGGRRNEDGSVLPGFIYCDAYKRCELLVSPPSVFVGKDSKFGSGCSKAGDRGAGGLGAAAPPPAPPAAALLTVMMAE